MDYSAPHVDVVIISYALTSLCLIGLIFFMVLRDRKLAKQMKDLNTD